MIIKLEFFDFLNVCQTCVGIETKTFDDNFSTQSFDMIFRHDLLTWYFDMIFRHDLSTRSFDTIFSTRSFRHDLFDTIFWHDLLTQSFDTIFRHDLSTLRKIRPLIWIFLIQSWISFHQFFIVVRCRISTSSIFNQNTLVLSPFWCIRICLSLLNGNWIIFFFKFLYLLL